eukprot:847239-Rhodomonas_salina.2
MPLNCNGSKVPAVCEIKSRKSQLCYKLYCEDCIQSIKSALHEKSHPSPKSGMKLKHPRDTQVHAERRRGEFGTPLVRGLLVLLLCWISSVEGWCPAPSMRITHSSSSKTQGFRGICTGKTRGNPHALQVFALEDGLRSTSERSPGHQAMADQVDSALNTYVWYPMPGIDSVSDAPRNTRWSRRSGTADSCSARCYP